MASGIGQLYQLRLHGFDASKHKPFTSNFYVRCSQCQAMCINGVATHEHGCPNAKHECSGCNEVIPANQKYCQDCR